MRKYITLLVAVLSALIPVSASAQFAIRADIVSVSYKQSQVDGKTLTYSNSGGFGAQIGAEYDLKVADGYSLCTGISWVPTSMTIQNEEEGVVQDEIWKENSLNIPLYIKAQYMVKPEVRNSIFLYAGPVLSYIFSSRSDIRIKSTYLTVNGTYDYLEGTPRFSPTGNSTIDSTLLPELEKELVGSGLMYKRFDIRLDLGFGVSLRDRYEIVSGFNMGAVNKYKGELGSDSRLTSSCIYLGVRYRFGAKAN